MTGSRIEPVSFNIAYKKDRNGLKMKIRKTAVTLLAVLIGIANLFPLIFMLSSSFKPLAKIFEFPFKIIPDPFISRNYINIFSPEYDFLLWYKNTVVMVVLTLVFKIAVVSITAYAFARLKFKGRDTLFVFFLAGLMMPGDATLVQRYIVYRVLNITDSVWALVLPAAFDIYFVFLLRQFFITIPYELTEAAIIDGCSHLKIFYKIIMPLAKPALITMVLFTFVWSWNDYTNPFIFISNLKKQMLTVGIATFQNYKFLEYGMQMAASSLALLPIIAVFLLSQKYFIEGLVTGSVKG